MAVYRTLVNMNMTYAGGGERIKLEPPPPPPRYFFT
jgi:hypothetical protein